MAIEKSNKKEISKMDENFSVNQDLKGNEEKNDVALVDLKSKKEINKSILILKKALAWTAVIFVVLFTIFMVIVGGFISDYEIKDKGGIIGVPLAMPIAVLIGTVVSLGAVLVMTWYFSWDPINEKLEARKKSIQKNIDDAKEKLIQAEMNDKISFENLKKSKTQSIDIIASSKKEGNNLKKEIIDSTKKQSETIISNSREQITLEKKQMQDEIKDEIISTSILAAEKIIEKELDDSKNQEMVIELINKLKE